MDSCSFNTSDAEIIVGAGGDPWAPTAGSMLQISTHVAQRLWRPLVRTAHKLNWRLPGGFEVRGVCMISGADEQYPTHSNCCSTSRCGMMPSCVWGSWHLQSISRACGSSHQQTRACLL